MCGRARRARLLSTDPLTMRCNGAPSRALMILTRSRARACTRCVAFPPAERASTQPLLPAPSRPSRDHALRSTQGTRTAPHTAPVLPTKHHKQARPQAGTTTSRHDHRQARNHLGHYAQSPPAPPKTTAGQGHPPPARSPDGSSEASSSPPDSRPWEFSTLPSSPTPAGGDSTARGGVEERRSERRQGCVSSKARRPKRGTGHDMLSQPTCGGGSCSSTPRLRSPALPPSLPGVSSWRVPGRKSSGGSSPGPHIDDDALEREVRAGGLRGPSPPPPGEAGAGSTVAGRVAGSCSRPIRSRCWSSALFRMCARYTTGVSVSGMFDTT